MAAPALLARKPRITFPTPRAKAAQTARLAIMAYVANPHLTAETMAAYGAPLDVEVSL